MTPRVGLLAEVVVFYRHDGALDYRHSSARGVYDRLLWGLLLQAFVRSELLLGRYEVYDRVVEDMFRQAESDSG